MSRPLQSWSIWRGRQRREPGGVSYIRARVTGVTRRASVFDDLVMVRGLIATVSQALPADFDWMVRTLALAQARSASAGFDAGPCHGDTNVFDVLMLDDGGVRLVDWDVAALMDPLQDIGALLAEIRPFDSDAREVFEMAWVRSAVRCSTGRGSTGLRTRCAGH